MSNFMAVKDENKICSFPIAGSRRRFDPTGYIKELERRKKEASLKK
jgi:hypothetical protein